MAVKDWANTYRIKIEKWFVFAAVSVMQLTGKSKDIPLEMRYESIRRRISEYCDKQNVNVTLSLQEENILFFFSSGEKHKLERIKAYIRTFKLNDAKTSEKFKFVISFGRIYDDWKYIKKSFQEAIDAFEVAKGGFINDKRIISYEDIGIYKVLFKIRDKEDLFSYCEDLLRDVFAYDRKHHSNLLYTLKKYSENNWNATKTAKNLSIHRNTLQYRLDKVADLLKKDVEDYSVRLDLMVCFAIMKIYPLHEDFI